METISSTAAGRLDKNNCLLDPGSSRKEAPAEKTVSEVYVPPLTHLRLEPPMCVLRCDGRLWKYRRLPQVHVQTVLFPQPGHDPKSMMPEEVTKL